MTASLAQLLQETLHEQIPITKAMNVSVTHYDGNSLHLSAPLIPNANDKNTAFGGSLSAITTVCGWGLLFLSLKKQDIQNEIVIQKSAIHYLKPVTGDFCAVTALPNDGQYEKFLSVLNKKGKARISLNTTILNDDQCAVDYQGQYVVRIKP